MESTDDQLDNVEESVAEDQETEQQDGVDQAANNGQTNVPPHAQDPPGSEVIDAEEEETQQQDGNDQAANNGQTNVSPHAQDSPGSELIGASMDAEEEETEQQNANDQAANDEEANMTPVAQDQTVSELSDVGMEAEEEETEHQDGIDQATDADQANMFTLPQDQPGSELIDVGAQLYSSGTEDDPAVIAQSEQENVFPFHNLVTIMEEKDDEEETQHPHQPISELIDVDTLPYISGAEENLVVNTQSELENVSEVLSTQEVINLVKQEDEEETTIEDNQEEDFVVLDADHPQLAKQQAALKLQILKELERLRVQLHEETGLAKTEATQTEDFYAVLYGEQQRLKTVQARLDGIQKTKVLAEGKHKVAQNDLKAVKLCHSSITEERTKIRANVTKLQTELERVMMHVTFTQQLSDELQANVKSTKNATKKVGTDKTVAEDQKLKQDIYVDRLTRELDRLTQQMDLYVAQTSAQAETTQATKEALSEAEMQMESLAMAQKQLLQQWNASLLNMRMQNEEFGTIQEAVSMAEHEVRLLDGEIEGNKKSISELQEKSESLTMLLNCALMDCDVSKKMISQKQTQYESLQAQYSTYVRAVAQTERTLTELTKEDNGLKSDVTDQRRKLEKNKTKHLELENFIMTQMLKKLMDSKAAQYYQRLTNKKASLKKEKIYQLWQLESSVMAAALESNVINEKLENLSRTQKELDEEIRKYNKVVESNQTNSSSIDALISQKQTTISNINKKIDLIASRTGHEDLSPLQIKAESIKTQIETLSQKIKNDQQLWLKLQGILIGLTLAIQTHNKEYNKLQAKYTVICQKKLYLERQLEIVLLEENEVEKSNKLLQRDLLKLNTLLNKNAQLRYALEQENAVMETEFLHKLKEAERGSLEMEAKLERIQEEKESILSNLVEAERQIMLWEKKTHVMKETRLVVQEGQQEIKSMRDDVHRMERWLNQLIKERERLMEDSVAVVERRGYIIERNEVMSRGTQKATNKGELNLINDGLRRKLKEINKIVKEYDQEIKELQDGQEEFQNKAKKIEEIIDGTPSSTSSLEAALEGETARVHTINTIIQRVWVEMPKYQGTLWKVLRSLAEQTDSEESSSSVG
ncbi:coiled-coil domain-containing protein 40 [Corythoichthys intestinalis]|uniref:coiled-coil domain-containing protein 40 n=1 Tax=Corythoichthys intestinalis TaxID=161448 RepID=UPI0025A5E04B|nr:coiled-coil domain-containing protein 40 [Corythoichthys intestinalis]